MCNPCAEIPPVYKPSPAGDHGPGVRIGDQTWLPEPRVPMGPSDQYKPQGAASSAAAPTGWPEIPAGIPRMALAQQAAAGLQKIVNGLGSLVLACMPSDVFDLLAGSTPPAVAGADKPDWWTVEGGRPPVSAPAAGGQGPAGIPLKVPPTGAPQPSSSPVPAPIAARGLVTMLEIDEHEGGSSRPGERPRLEPDYPWLPPSDWVGNHGGVDSPVHVGSEGLGHFDKQPGRGADFFVGRSYMWGQIPKSQKLAIMATGLAVVAAIAARMATAAFSVFVAPPEPQKNDIL